MSAPYATVVTTTTLPANPTASPLTAAVELKRLGDGRIEFTDNSGNIVRSRDKALVLLVELLEAKGA